MLKLSLIIPVYNEEHHIRGCLDAISRQSEMPDEVIVVDNNCTDRTIDIAKTYDFVTVIAEPKQGRAHARNAGFNAAKHDILGRIDSDSLLSRNWVETVKRHFASDNQLSGLTGLSSTPILPLLRWPKSTLFSRTYYWNVHGVFGTITTWGATMAVRKNSWEMVKNDVCLDDKKAHEDQDIALWMASKSQKIIQANDVRITAYNQSFRYLPKMLYYIKLRNQTKKRHLELGNLPAPENLRFPMFQRIGSFSLSIPALIYGILVGIVFLPLDWLMIKVVKSKTWFD